jgi:hypothetical protein
MKIIYKNIDNTIAILTPTEDCLQSYTIQQIALKDTPQGLPFWIVEDSIIPSDRTFRNAWEVDEASLGVPHGYGSEFHTFEELGVNND